MATTNEKASNWWDLAQDAWLSTFATKFEACSCRLWPLLDLPVQTSLKEVKCVWHVRILCHVHPKIFHKSRTFAISLKFPDT